MVCFKKPFQGVHPSVQINPAATAESPFAVIPAISPFRQDIFQSAEQVLRIIAGNQAEFLCPPAVPERRNTGWETTEYRGSGFPEMTVECPSLREEHTIQSAARI